MVTTLDEWAALGVGFVSATEVFDSTTPQGQLLLHLTSAFAEFERNLIIERTKARIAAARRRGSGVIGPTSRVELVIGTGEGGVFPPVSERYPGTAFSVREPGWIA